MARSRIRKAHFLGALCLAFGVAVFDSPASAQVAKPTVDLSIYRHIVQVGWVVKDLDSVVDYWEKLGLKNIARTGVVENPTTNYRGKKTSLSMKMAFGDIGGVQIEWIQPVAGEGVYNEFLRAHGDGVHHLAYAVPSPEGLDEQIRYFKQRGADVVQSGSWIGKKGEGRFAYLDTAAKGGGITIELVYNPDAPSADAEPQSTNDYPFSKIIQYAFVVRDVHKVSAFWERLGFGGLQVDHNISLNRDYRGAPGNFEMYLGWGRAGDVPFEWIQSLKGPSVYDEVLKEHGEGFHHLAFSVTDMDKAIEQFKAKDVAVAQSGGWDSNGNKGRFAYLDTDSHGGVTIELLWNEPRGK